MSFQFRTASATGAPTAAASPLRATSKQGRVLAARALLAAGLCALPSPAALAAQEGATHTRRVISIGNHPRVDGLRINFRDRDLGLVRGVNVTLWNPERDARGGTVKGFAIGLPLTGAGEIRGFGAGIFGVEAEGDIRGITLAGVGAGAGGTLSGISIAGIGAGAGGGVRGLTVGGIGVGSGGDIGGIAVGGIGAGAGGDVRGIVIGGIGAAAGGSVTGLAVGGVGVGGGGDVRGIAIGGVGVGAGGRLTGLAIGGIGVGAGGTFHGLGIAGVGVGAPTLEGGAIASMVGGRTVRAVVIAPILFRTTEDAEFTGASLSSVNAVRGHQTGLTIGIVNYAESLFGMQLGVVNVVRDNPSGRRVLPIVNWGGSR